ncbi:unnamed protein product [Parnassius mnemosyne]|uniref:PiggyBac transposable element-derived protein domain-containing protein n=1 Tax=Parnassius mnemosyne TaxID=213953 RepID=A0AAV1LLJ9_9NEOP
MPSTSSATISKSSTSATTLTTGNNEPSLSGTTSEWLKQKLDSIEWHMPTQEGPTPMKYTGPISGFKEIYSGILANASPIDYFDLFMTNEIIQHIVDQTNLYATQQLLSNDIPSGSRQHAWVPVTLDEMKKFLALIGWMGLVKLPSIKDYWRVHKLYNIPLARTVMPRNRFELLLKFIHFSDNTLADPSDRLYKLRDILDKFINNYKKTYTPGEKNMCRRIADTLARTTFV